jgi:hypothetical protein
MSPTETGGIERGADDLTWLGPPTREVDGGRIWSTGYAFTADGRCIEDEAVGDVLWRERHRLERAADNLNGCFAAVFFTRDGAIALTDRDGSFPLYFGRDGDRLFLSNDPWHIVDARSQPAELDEASVLDMMRLGYVTGERTLARGVSIMPPATIWRVKHNHVTPSRYWQFRVAPKRAPAEESEAQLADALRGMGHSITEHLRASGRSSAMALSGGLDTRLLTSLFVREGIENFRAFSYGAPGDPEIEAGQQVAKLLGVPHDRVELSPSYLNDTFIDEAVRTVGFTTRFTCGVGIRHYDRPVDVFLTGHGGCFSDFNYGLLTAPIRTREQARRYLYWRNYQLDASDDVPRRVFNVDYERVKWASLDETLEPLDPSADPIGELYRWGLENRQRKLILMEHRLYEQRGRWILPIHDHRVTAYFLSAPRPMLIGQRAYKDVALDLFRSLDPELAALPRIGGSMGHDPKMAVAVEASRRMGRLADPLFPLLIRRSKAFQAAPPVALGADPFRYWFHTDPVARDNMLERITALDIPMVNNKALRDALVSAQSDKIFMRLFPGAITVQSFSDLLRARRGAARPSSEAASA